MRFLYFWKREPEPEFVAETLDWCNGMREIQGKMPLTKMPKGIINDPLSCPCGKAAGVWVESENWNYRGQKEAYPLPDAVQQFVREFDSGKLPQYQEKS